MANKTKKDSEQLGRIYRAVGDRIDFTLAELIRGGKPIPPALATAATNYLKLHGIGEEIAQNDADEAAAIVMQKDFVPRAGVLDEAPWNADDAELTRIANEQQEQQGE